VRGSRLRWIRKSVAIAALSAVALASSRTVAQARDAHDRRKPHVPAPASPTNVLVKPRRVGDLGALSVLVGARSASNIPGTTWWRMKVPVGRPGIAAALLARDRRVERATIDRGVDYPEGGGSTIPCFGDDPVASVGTQSAVQSVGTSVALSRTTGAGVIVAVVDTGVAANHPLLQGHLAAGGYDFVEEDSDPADVGNGSDDNGDGDVDEGVGHGTFVSSLVLAVAPGARVLPLRALNSDSCGTVSGVAMAIGRAVQCGARVINLSLGMTSGEPVLDEAVDSARAAGAVLVCAAGNDGVAVLDYPASERLALGVTGVDFQDTHAPFSQYGRAADLCACAVKVVGAFPGSPSGTARWSGTSFSAALASGGAALVRARYPAWSVTQVENQLRTTSVDVSDDNPGFGGLLGGRLNLDAATR
jgi:subtilisin family serine protease